MRRSGAWMQLCSKLGARARCGWSAPHIMPVSDIFLGLVGLSRPTVANAQAVLTSPCRLKFSMRLRLRLS